ncbi:hypothetical protein [Halorubrum sp. Boch-26]|nr:hypothetical protein [Halorubrum sp. Boch-26]
MIDPTLDRSVDRSADADDDSTYRQHASADVAPELFEDGPAQR